ncbi:MAG TPA: hypothetical protein VGJ63_10830 [Micromonosporaceae bacterium]
MMPSNGTPMPTSVGYLRRTAIGAVIPTAMTDPATRFAAASSPSQIATCVNSVATTARIRSTVIGSNRDRHQRTIHAATI